MMIHVPLNHKCIFLFDHSIMLSKYCGQTYEFDVINKEKSQTSASASAGLPQPLEPLNKTLWTCSIESAIEFSRIVYDVFPTNKLISMLVSAADCPYVLNSWNDNEQGLDHLMNVMGTVAPPLEAIGAEQELINLYKALNTSIIALSQVSPFQESLVLKHKNEQIPNSGRIILYTVAKYRNLDQIEDLLVKALEECNKNVEINSFKKLKVQRIELVVIDVAPNDQTQLLYPQETVKTSKNSDKVQIRVLSTHAGRVLPLKMLQLLQNFYNLAVTSITNIPMKEELNANSSANYDVELLHEKAVHDQLRSCGLLRNCIVQKENLDVVCLKWSNPKTNITEFNLSSGSYRITPTDINSRPTACLTTFLLSGRCVVLEARNVDSSGAVTRVPSHVLCNYGNEIFIHCLQFCGKSYYETPIVKPVTSNPITDYRINEFVEFMKANRFQLNGATTPQQQQQQQPAALVKNENQFETIAKSIERMTRKWPLTYSDNIVTNVTCLKPLVKFICEETMTPLQYNECVKCIETLQALDLKNELLTSGNILITPSKTLKQLKKPEQYKLLWTELENWLKCYENLSDKHKMLYECVCKIRKNTVVGTDQLVKSEPINSQTVPPVDQKSDKIDVLDSLYENEKLQRKGQLNLSYLQSSTNLYNLWINSLNKPQREFYGRVTNPTTNTAPLYGHLKIDETNSKPFSGSKMDM